MYFHRSLKSQLTKTDKRVIGSLLEFVHGSWRVALIHTMGVITAALFSMPLSPFNFLVGASGGDYALIAACIANLLLNWDSMDSLLAKYGRLSLIVCWAVLDIGLLIHRNITQQAGFEHVSNNIESQLF